MFINFLWPDLFRGKNMALLQSDFCLGVGEIERVWRSMGQTLMKNKTPRYTHSLSLRLNRSGKIALSHGRDLPEIATCCYFKIELQMLFPQRKVVRMEPHVRSAKKLLTK